MVHQWEDLDTLSRTRQLTWSRPSVSRGSYHPLPIVFDRAFGAHVWDPEVSLVVSIPSLAPVGPLTDGLADPFFSFLDCELGQPIH